VACEGRHVVKAFWEDEVAGLRDCAKDLQPFLAREQEQQQEIDDLRLSRPVHCEACGQAADPMYHICEACRGLFVSQQQEIERLRAALAQLVADAEYALAQGGQRTRPARFVPSVAKYILEIARLTQPVQETEK